MQKPHSFERNPNNSEFTGSVTSIVALHHSARPLCLRICCLRFIGKGPQTLLVFCFERLWHYLDVMVPSWNHLPKHKSNKTSVSSHNSLRDSDDISTPAAFYIIRPRSRHCWIWLKIKMCRKTAFSLELLWVWSVINTVNNLVLSVSVILPSTRCQFQSVSPFCLLWFFFPY